MQRLTIAALIIFATVAESQAGSLEVAWSRNISASVWINGLSINPQGGVTVVGDTFISAFGPLAGSYDSFAASYDDAGALVWGTQFGAANGNYEEGQAVAVDRFGYAIVGGTQQQDAYAAKYDASGSQQWFKGFGSPQNLSDETYGLATDAAGNIYASGNTSVTGLGSVAFLSKLDSAGEVVWNKNFANLNNYRIVQDTAENLYLYGFGPAPAGNGMYLVKVDTSGNELWRHAFGTSLPTIANDVVVDASGNVYLTGSTTNTPGANIYLAKYDSLGNLIWRQDSATSGSDRGFKLAIDPQGNIFLAGGSDGSLASDNLGRTDAVVLKYDPDGNLLDSIQFGGPLHDIIFDMAIDGFGNVYVGGGQRIVNQNNSPHNGWLVKLTPVPEPSTYVLAAIGFVALLAMRRRKIQAA